MEPTGSFISNSRMNPNRRTFLLKSVVFLCAFVVLSFTLDFFYAYFIQHNYSFKPSRIVTVKPAADILILGNSRAELLSQEVLKKKTGLTVYNLAIVAQNLDDQLLLLHLYLKNNPRPKLICIELSPEYLALSPLMFHPYFFMNYLDDPFILKTVTAYVPELAWLRFFPLIKYGLYNDPLLKLAVIGAVQNLTKKKDFMSLQKSPPERTLPVFSVNPLRGKEIRFLPNAVKTLNDLLDLAKKSSDHVFFYEAPIFAEALSEMKNRKEAVKELDVLFERYGVSYIRFQDLPLNSNRDLFYDSHHLNAKGSRIFDEIFADFVAGYLQSR